MSLQVFLGNSIFISNSNFTLPLPYRKAKCLFEKASLFAHSCSPNCSWNIEFNQNDRTNEGEWRKIQIEVVTAVPIRKGEMLTIFYSTRYARYGTLKRIVLMEEIAHFLCKCSRCEDRTELGTFMSAVKCTDCKKNYLLPEEPIDIHSKWKCLNTFCGSTQSVNKIVFKICQLEEYVERIKCLNLNVQEELKLLEIVISKYTGILLHKNHYALQEISSRILQLLVEREESILDEENSSEVYLPNLELFITHCKYLLDIAHLILPAMTGYIGKIEYFKMTPLISNYIFISGTLETYLQKAESIRIKQTLLVAEENHCQVYN